MQRYFKNTIHGLAGVLCLSAVTHSVPVHAQTPSSMPTQEARNAHETTFFHALNDVPVMEGLRELPDESINFDKPEGRIVTATAVSDHLKPEKIRAFYDQTLPQLGWARGADGTFTREQERMKLIIEEKQGVSIARFTVEPR